MMKLKGTNLAITDDNTTICTDGNEETIEQFKRNAKRPDGYTEDFIPHIEQMNRGRRTEAGILD